MLVSQQDIITGSIALLVIGLALALLQVAVRWRFVPMADARKLLHLVAIGTCAVAIQRFENLHLLAGVLLLAAVLLTIAVHKGLMQVGTQRSYGICLFPLAFGLLLLCPWLGRAEAVLSAWVLAISDAAAGWLGGRYARQYHRFLYETKSWLGFGIFFIAALAIFLVYTNSCSMVGLLWGVCFALLPALTELFSYRGSDNFTVPLATAFWYMLLQRLSYGELQMLALFVLAAAPLAAAAVRRQWLLPGGAAAALWMGLIFWACGGWRALVLPALFLSGGSLLSKLNGDKEESGGRHAVQVFANGLVGAVCWALYGLSGKTYWLLASQASFAISLADTVSSEAGRYLKGRTVDILRWQPLQRGLSGGVSLGGTVAGLLAAAAAGLLAARLFNFSWKAMAVVAITGFVGMLADSVLGSRWQALYQGADGHLAERWQQGARLVKGHGWCTNHTVNLLSNILVISIMLAIFYVLT
jgi:uncharacterized protein (TIGR00297 family)